MGEPTRTWPGDTLTRVPFWVYQDEANYQAELRRIFEGPTWNYLCLESDVARPGEFRTTFVGEMPVIVVRGKDGGIHAFENRCAHRGALIAIDDAGSVKNAFQCVYHAWSYDLSGNLIGIAFEKGSNGRGGMPRTSARPITARGSCAPRRCVVWSSARWRPRRRRSRRTSAARFSAGCAA